MAQRRNQLIKALKLLQRKFPEFADILEEVIQAIGGRDIDMRQEKHYW